MKNLKNAFPARSVYWRLYVLLRSQFHLGSMLFLYLKVIARGRKLADKILITRGFEVIRDHYGDKPVLILTGHTGNWELAGYAHAIKRGKELVTVGRPMRTSRMLGKFIQMKRRNLNMIQLDFYNSFFSMGKYLSKGHDVALLIDHNTPRKYAIFEKFFGVDASYPRSAFLISRRYSVPVVIAFSRYERGKVIVEYVTFIDGVQSPEQLYRIYGMALEKFILECPWQWLWIHDRWRERPGQDNGL